MFNDVSNYDAAYAGVNGIAMLAVIGVGLVCLAIGLLMYFLFSYALYKVAENEGVENTWFAYVPILQYYIVAKVAGEVKIGSYVVPRPELVLTIGWLLTFIPLLGTVFSILQTVIYYAAFHAIYKKYRGDKATLMLVISILTCGIGTIVYLFKLKNESPLNNENSMDNYTL